MRSGGAGVHEEGVSAGDKESEVGETGGWCPWLLGCAFMLDGGCWSWGLQC